MWLPVVAILCVALLFAWILWRSRGDYGAERFGADARLDAETVRHKHDPWH